MSDFLEEVEPDESASALGQVMAQANRLIELRQKIEKAEEELAELNRQEREMSREVVPGLLLQHGLESLKLANGLTVSIKEELEVGVPKNDTGRNIVLGWLSRNGAGDLIKEELSFQDPDDDIKRILNEKGMVFEESKTVNAQSLKAWFREALGMKKSSVARIATTDVPKEANLFIYKKTVIS